jgi:hypothetical protein
VYALLLVSEDRAIVPHRVTHVAACSTVNDQCHCMALPERDLLALALRDTKTQYNRLIQAVGLAEINDRRVRMAREQGIRGESKQRRHVWVVCPAPHTATTTKFRG